MGCGASKPPAELTLGGPLPSKVKFDYGTTETMYTGIKLSVTKAGHVCLEPVAL